MTKDSEAPLGPPPRKAHVRRAARNLRRAYGSLFLLVIFVFGGWAGLDAVRWPELTGDQRLLTVGFAAAALIALIIYQLVDHPLRRELRLARRGVVAQGHVVSVGRRRTRRATPIISYTFQIATGETIQGNCNLPRRFPLEMLEAGMAIEVLYDARKPRLNKPVLALEYVEFSNRA